LIASDRERLAQVFGGPDADPESRGLDRPERLSRAKIPPLADPRVHLTRMDDATGRTLEVDLHRALEKVVLAISEVIPGSSDVIDPRALVRRWTGQLDQADRARFLMLVLSEGWERHVGAIARAVLAGETAWSPSAAEPG
jgi:hypothetical protein